MNQKKNTIRKYLRYNIKLFQLLGLWPEESDISQTTILWKIHLVVVHILFVGLYNVQQIVYLCLFEDFSSFVLCGFSVLSSALPSIKTYIFLSNLPLIREIENLLDKDNFQTNNTRQEENVRQNFQIQRWINNTFMVIVIAYTGIWISMQFFKNDRALPFYCWYPYDFRKPLYYEISWIHQLVSVFYCCIVCVNFDMFAIALMICIGLECDMVADTVENIEEFTRPRKLTAREMLTGQSINKTNLSLDDRMNNTLIGCVRRYKDILM